MRASNFISLTGNLGGNVEVRKASSGDEVARLSIAETVSRPNAKTGEYEQVHTNWIPVTAFGSLARRAAQALKKGDRITITGAIKTSSFEKDGASRKTFEVIAYSIERAQLLAKAGAGDLGLAAQFPPFDEFSGDGLAADPLSVK